VRTLWHSCAKVCEAVELLFGVVSGVAPGIGVLDGDPGPPRERGVIYGGGSPIGLNSILSVF